jgi:hypothetical protein
MAANPLPSELDLPDDVADSRPPLDLLTNEGRVALTDVLHKDPATAPRARKRPWWARPAIVFATACLLVVGAIGIVVVSNGGQSDFVDDSAPTTVPTTADGTSVEWIDYPILDTAIAADGSLWATTDRSILRWDMLTGETTAFTTADGLPSMGVFNLQAGVEGTVWVGSAGWMASFEEGAWTVVSAPTESPGPLAVGPDGAVWTVFGERTLARFRDSDWESFEVPIPDTNSAAIPWSGSLDVSPDGTVWAGTHEYKGVFSFDGTDWTHHTHDDGLPSRVGWTVAAAPDGSVWAGSVQVDSNLGGGVAHFDGTAWTHYTTEDGLHSMSAEIAVGADGTVWAIHESGVSRFDGTGWTAFPEIVGNGRGASVDATGKLWMPAAEAGVISVIGFDRVDITRLSVPLEEVLEAQTQPPVAPPAGTWNPILATTRAKPAPPAATCPPDTDPNAPGPADEERPEEWEGSNPAAAFDRHAGRIVWVDTLGETWTFDVCANTWHRMNPTGAMIGELSGGMVYDVDSDLTVALGFEHISVYDANTNTWTQPSNNTVGIGDDLIVPTGAAYDPVTGLIVTSNHRWTSETSPLYWEFWAYDVDTNEWTALGPLRTEPSKQEQLDFLGYSEQLDRLIGAGYLDGEVGTILVDPRTGDVTVLPIESPVVDIGWPNETYGAAGGTVYTTTNTVDTPHDVCGFDANARSWTTCFDLPDDTYTGGFPFPSLVGDPVNNRLVVINPSASALATASRFGAIDLATGEWTQLLAPSDQ